MPDFKSFSDVDLIEAAGRLHPLLLHLPIGILVGLFLIELPGLIRRTPAERNHATTTLLGLLAITAPLTALTGWLLHESGHFGAMVERHEYLGIGTMVTALLAAAAYWKRHNAYRPLLVVAVLVLIPTAHVGASLTHGEDFLLEPWVEVPPPPPGEVFETTVLPIFMDLCVRCHDERRQKADLFLDSLANLERGSESGQVFTPGNPTDSLLIKALRLPPSADEHMPPESKPQPTEEEIQLIEAWILSLETPPQL